MHVRRDPRCPRCGGELHAPGLWSSAWLCGAHGAVHPVQPVVQPRQEVVSKLAAHARVPVWVPWPLPRGWLVSGVASAGDDRSGPRGTAVACTGPAPLGGAGEMVLVAEEPGVGLGARYAGLAGPDPGSLPELGVPHAKVQAAGHPTPLWVLDGPTDRAVYVGEALGHWLWVVLWPEAAGLMLLEDLALTDLRDPGHPLDLPFGALSSRLVDP
jgi:hypothetical protein